MRFEYVAAFCAENGLDYNAERDEKLGLYADFLLEYNKKVNLTAITDPKEIEIKHFCDSLTAAAAARPITGRLLDVGSGAGFPGVVLGIMFPEAELVLMDSNGKKAEFLSLLCARLGMKEEIICGRAEDLGAAGAPMREAFDFVTARAVARLNLLAEYCLPLVKKGGVFICMKGSRGQEELSEAETALAVLGAKHERTASFELADGSGRELFLIRKTERTPTGYPRKNGKILKKPL